jgi:hypothetical protein
MQGYTVKAGKARKVTERKICNTYLLETWEAIFKYDEKGREGEESDGKKDGQYAFIKVMGQLGLNVA